MSKVETAEFGAMVRRMIRAYGRRVADADEIELAQLVETRDALEEAIEQAVVGQRELHGRSWADVAPGLGVSRQEAHRRYSKAVMA